MSLRNKQFNGFKFSFKKQENSACSTPKFTSIQLDHNQISNLRRKQVMRPARSIRRDHKKQTEEMFHYHSVSTPKLNQNKIASSHKVITVKAQIEENSHIEQHIGKIPQVKKEKPSLLPEKAHLSGDLLKRPRVLKTESYQKLLKPLREQKEQASLTYLQIFKRDKHKQKKNILHQLNLSLKKEVDGNSLIERDESPKSTNSHRSFRETPKIFNKFFPKNTEMEELLEATGVPQTEKNKKLNEEVPNQFFRKAETKKNLSKALFKTQKTNLNVRLNNIGGGISKLNIRID